MKILIKLSAIAVLLSFTSCINAQFGKRIRGNGEVITKTRNVSDYDRISLGGSFDVKLVSGREGEITIKAESNLLEYIVTEVDGDNLKIRWERGMSIHNYKNILITVPFEDIEAVSLSGSGDIFSEDPVRTDHFKASLSGSGDLKLDLFADEISSSIYGSGDIDLSGKVKQFECSITGSGDIEAYDLKSTDADIRIVGSGSVEITVSDNLKARIIGSGDVNYKGDPKMQDVRVTGSGDVSSH